MLSGASFRLFRGVFPVPQSMGLGVFLRQNSLHHIVEIGRQISGVCQAEVHPLLARPQQPQQFPGGGEGGQGARGVWQ